LVVDDMVAPFAAAMARAYNDWMYDFCKKDPSRLIAAAMISPFDMHDAVSEARRCAEQLGFRAVFLRAVPLVDHQWEDNYYEPLWDALEALNLSVGLLNPLERTGGPAPELNLMLRRGTPSPSS
jgi:predicted TIM-barrel fold metal-dependent hydrolase